MAQGLNSGTLCEDQTNYTVIIVNQTSSLITTQITTPQDTIIVRQLIRYNKTMGLQCDACLHVVFIVLCIYYFVK